MPEEPFVPGIDPGLKAWLIMRDEVRNARKTGSNTYTITSDIPYKHNSHWIDILHALDEEELRILIEKKDLNHPLWKRLDCRNCCTNDEFEALLSALSPTMDSGLIEDYEKLYTYAIDHRSLILLEKLIVRSAFDMNYLFTRFRRTLLQRACIHGDLEKVRFLLQNNANINIADSKGSTALHLAVHPDSIFHSMDIPTLLLRNGALVNAVDNYGRSPLHYACLARSPNLCRLLLKHGADMTILDCKNSFPLDYSKEIEVNRVFAEFSILYGRKAQFLRVKARHVATQFVSDLFRVVQPKCTVCKRALSKCALLKKTNYRYWMHAHRRFAKETYTKDKENEKEEDKEES